MQSRHLISNIFSAADSSWFTPHENSFEEVDSYNETLSDFPLLIDWYVFLNLWHCTVFTTVSANLAHANVVLKLAFLPNASDWWIPEVIQTPIGDVVWTELLL